MAPVASAGRTVRKPAALGPTTVTFNDTAVAPVGTTTCTPSVVAIEPVTNRSRGIGAVNMPESPRLVRVSRTRTGVIATNDEAAESFAALPM